MDTTKQAVKIINLVLARLDVANKAAWYDTETYLTCEDRRAILEGALRKVRELLKGAE